MKVAIFARVSTDAQSTARQISDLQTLCQTNGWTVAHTITEQISGAAATTQRAGIQELFDIATRRQVKKVVITEVSRIGRNVSEAVAIIDQLTAAGVSLYIQNIGLETLLPDGKPNFMFKPILLTLVGFAEMERDLLRERIKSGQAQARKAGKQIGRPKGTTTTPDDLLAKYPAVVKHLRRGYSVRTAAAVCRVSAGTVQRVKHVLFA